MAPEISITDEKHVFLHGVLYIYTWYEIVLHPTVIFMLIGALESGSAFAA